MNAQSIDDAVSKTTQSLRESGDSCRQNYEEKIRNAPWQAVGIAAVAGFVLRSAPVMLLLGTLVRVLLALVKPALIVLAVKKGVELVQASKTAPVSGPVNEAVQ